MMETVSSVDHLSWVLSAVLVWVESSTHLILLVKLCVYPEWRIMKLSLPLRRAKLFKTLMLITLIPSVWILMPKHSYQQMIWESTYGISTSLINHSVSVPYETTNVDIVDIKPVNMEELTEVITAAEFHPVHCNYFAYSSSKGTIKLADMRESALCDHHAKRPPSVKSGW
jgi:hypothetical protein